MLVNARLLHTSCNMMYFDTLCQMQALVCGRLPWRSTEDLSGAAIRSVLFHVKRAALTAGKKIILEIFLDQIPCQQFHLFLPTHLFEPVPSYTFE